MKQKELLKRVAPVLALTQLAAIAMALAPNLASAHGSMVNPPSREYYCKTSDNPEGPKTAGCKAVISKNGNGIIYDWMSNAQSSANGEHKKFVPDGMLCSGGKTTRDGLDAIADWKSTTITPDANGMVELHYKQTAPHQTRYFKNYITKDSFDGSRALRWDDLQLIGEVGAQSAETDTKMKVKIPAGMTGKRVIYNVWQRSDSPEAFYACSDVEIPGATDSSWKAMGPIEGGDAKAGTEITLRVFDMTRGTDRERHTISVAASQTNAAEWIYALAQKVNSDSKLVKVGKLGADDKVVPVKSNKENSIFGIGKKFNFAIDLNAPGEGGGDNGTPPPVNQPPVAKISGPSSANAAQNVALSAAGSSDADGDALTYTWTVPAGITATPNGAALNFVAPTLDRDASFTFQVAANDGKASATASHTMTVKAKPTDGGTPPAGTTKIEGPATLTAGTPASLKATSGFKGKVNYKWNASKDLNGTVAGRQYQIVPKLVDSNTTYTIKVVATSLEGATKDEKREGEFTLTVTPKPPVGSDNGAPYQAGKTYQAGDVVTNNGNSYECKPFPNSGWCGQSPAHYEPGVGSAWSDAWTAK